MIATQEVAIAVELGEAERLVIDTIIAGPTWSRPVELLRRISGLCICGRFDRELIKVAGDRCLAGLVSGGWIMRWTPPPDRLLIGTKERTVARPEVATFTSIGAARLGYTLAQPAQDGPRAEPFWIRTDSEFFDEVGRHPHEPDHFRILNDLCGIRRSKTLIERILAARDQERKLRKSGKIWKKSSSRAEQI